MGGVVSNLTSCMGGWSTAWRGLALTANSTCRPCFYHQEMEHGQQLILPDVLPLLDRQWEGTWQKSSSIFPSIEKEGEAILLGHLGISLVFPLVISFCIPSLHASKEIDSCFLLFHLLPNGIVVPVWQHNLNCSSVDTPKAQTLTILLEHFWKGEELCLKETPPTWFSTLWHLII
jgi:hypothetical protein